MEPCTKIAGNVNLPAYKTILTKPTHIKTIFSFLIHLSACNLF